MKKLQVWLENSSAGQTALKVFDVALLVLMGCWLLVMTVVFLAVAIVPAIVILGMSAFATLRWHTRTKCSKRAYYRKWLREILRKDLGKFRGKDPVILHIDGPSGYDWRSTQYLKPYQKPIWNGYRSVPIGSDDWRGYVHRKMRSVRYLFAQNEVCPAIGTWVMILTLLDL